MQTSLASFPRVLVSYFFALFLAALGGQTPGSLDPTFKTGSTLNGAVNAVAVAADGKIYIVGDFVTTGGIACNRIARLNPDGSADETFNPGLGANDTVQSVAIRGDGKVVIVGEFTFYNGVGRKHIARINSDGSLDATFKPGLGPDGDITAFALQPDGKIVIAGDFNTVGITPRNRIARLNADGSVDSGFNPGSGPNGSVRSVALQGDGKVLIGGTFGSYNGVERLGIARLHSNGALDTTFDQSVTFDGLFKGPVTTIVAQTDGKVLIGGSFKYVGGVPRKSIARLESNGVLDASFDPGTGPNDAINSIARQKDGKLLVGGAFASFNGMPRSGTARLNSDGSVDPTFDPGWGADLFGPRGVSSIAIQGSDKLIVGGTFTSYGGLDYRGVVRLNGNGSLDPGFDASSGANGGVLCAAVRPDGKVLIGGYFSRYSGTSRKHLAQINRDGSLDLSFDPGLGADNDILSLVAQPNGKVLIAGHFRSYNGVARSGIARLNSDGSLDGGFVPALGDQAVLASATLPDGKVLVWGSSFNSTQSDGLARLNSDGSLDASFNVGSGPNTTVWSILPLGDGKVLIAGDFSSYNGTPRNRIARLNNDGSLDTTFDPGAGANDIVRTMAIQGNGKILIAGSFTTFNNAPCMRVARLNVDGTLDATFDIATGANGDVYNLALQSDGKVLIGGLFSKYKDVKRYSLARFDSDGSLDAAFVPDTTGEIYTVALQEDGRAIIGGTFAVSNGVGRSFLARLHNGPPTRKLGTVDLTQVIWRREGSVPDLPSASFELSSDGGLSWSPLGEGTRIGNSGNWQLSGLALPASGLLRARGCATSGYGNGSISIVEHVEPISLATVAPTLIAPTDGTVASSSVNVSFTLPEAALPGSVKLNFGDRVLALHESQTTAGTHSFAFNPA